MDDPFVGSEITVGELIRALQKHDPALPVTFADEGYFHFDDIKNRDGVVQIIFSEIEGIHFTLTDEHPHRKRLAAEEKAARTPPQMKPWFGDK